MDSQKSKVQGKLRKGVFFPAAGALVIFIGLVAAFPDKAYEVLTGLLYKMGGSCGWAIELLIFFVFVGGLILACTKYGNIRIGGDNAKPRYKHVELDHHVHPRRCRYRRRLLGTGRTDLSVSGTCKLGRRRAWIGSSGNMGCIADYVPLVLRTVCILFRTCYRFRSASL